MSPLIFAILQGAKVALEVKKKLKKTPQEKRKQAMEEFDKAMKKAVEKEDTTELEKWFSGQL
jgi:uncharacterized membrane protein (DUF106 family)